MTSGSAGSNGTLVIYPSFYDCLWACVPFQSLRPYLAFADLKRSKVHPAFVGCAGLLTNIRHFLN